MGTSMAFDGIRFDLDTDFTTIIINRLQGEYGPLRNTDSSHLDWLRRLYDSLPRMIRENFEFSFVKLLQDPKWVEEVASMAEWIKLTHIWEPILELVDSMALTSAESGIDIKMTLLTVLSQVHTEPVTTFFESQLNDSTYQGFAIKVLANRDLEVVIRKLPSLLAQQPENSDFFMEQLISNLEKHRAKEDLKKVSEIIGKSPKLIQRKFLAIVGRHHNIDLADLKSHLKQFHSQH